MKFVDMNKREVFDVSSWDAVANAEGLAKMLNEMDRDYHSVYNVDAIEESIMFKILMADNHKWLTSSFLKNFYEILNTYDTSYKKRSNS